MSVNTRLLESINLVVAAAPADFNSAVTVDWISLKNYDGCLIVVIKAAGTAGDDFSLQTVQATDVAGTGSKALTFKTWYHKIGTQTGVGTFTKVTESTATSDLDLGTPTDYAADSVQAMFVIDIRASDLDVDGGFDCISYTHDDADVGSTALATILFIPYGARYAQASPLTAIAD
jgi:hypothetical protein